MCDGLLRLAIVLILLALRETLSPATLLPFSYSV